MSEESGRLRRALERLMDAQGEAIEAAGLALDAESEGWDEEEGQGPNERLQVALVDVRDILEGAMDDAREILEGGA